jgi:hypothetical protein
MSQHPQEVVSSPPPFTGEESEAQRAKSCAMGLPVNKRSQNSNPVHLAAAFTFFACCTCDCGCCVVVRARLGGQPGLRLGSAIHSCILGAEGKEGRGLRQEALILQHV